MSNNSGANLEKPPHTPGVTAAPPPVYPGATGAYPYQNGVGAGDQPPPYFSAGPVPPPPGWNQAGPPPPPNYAMYNYGSTNAIMSEPCIFPATQVIIVGGCPACRVGVLEDNFSCLGVLCAILFFPLGILCCLALRDKRCTNCGAIF